MCFISNEQTKPVQKKLEKSLAKWQEKNATLLQPVIAQTESEVYEAKASGELATAAMLQKPIPPVENIATHRSITVFHIFYKSAESRVKV